jgi:hypothetical protein
MRMKDDEAAEFNHDFHTQTIKQDVALFATG